MPSVAADGAVYIDKVDDQLGSQGRLIALNPNGTGRWELVLPCALGSSAVGYDGRVFFTCGDGNLYAVSSAGRIEWTHAVQVGSRWPPAIAPDGAMYVVGPGRVNAIAPDGAETWTIPVFGAGSAPAIVGGDGTIYLGTDRNGFFALNPDGSVKWTAPGVSSTGPAAIGPGGTVYAPAGDNLIAFGP
jgi:hypothetical protein